MCTCRHFDAQVSRGQKWGFRENRGSTLGTARSPLYIEVGVCRAVVRHTRVRRLQIQGKCNRRRENCGNVGKRRYRSFELVFCSPCTPLAGNGCVASNNAKCGIWDVFVLGLSNWTLGLGPVQNKLNQGFDNRFPIYEVVFKDMGFRLPFSNF